VILAYLMIHRTGKKIFIFYFFSSSATVTKSRFRSTQVTLRVFRADHTHLPTRKASESSAFSLDSPDGSHDGDDDDIPIFQVDYLRPPEIEKNFLISPPGSPPVGWEPIREDPPNAAPLADDLIAALRTLRLKQHTQQGFEVLLEPNEGVGVGVYVEDCDSKDGDGMDLEDDEGWVYGETAPARQKWMPVPTAMPPMRSAIAM
jgi:hypothetical protein